MNPALLNSHPNAINIHQMVSTSHSTQAPSTSRLKVTPTSYDLIVIPSKLSLQASVMRNTVVELLATRQRLEILLHNEIGQMETHWVNGHPVSRPYRCVAAGFLPFVAAIVYGLCLLVFPQ